MSGPPLIFDHALADTRRRRALAAPVAGADFLYRTVAEDMAERLAAVKRRFAIARRDRQPVPGARRHRPGRPHRAARPHRRDPAGRRRRCRASALRARKPRPRRLRTLAARGKRPPRRARPDAPGAEAGRPVPRRLSRRQYARRAAPGLCHGRSGDHRRRLAARGALHRCQDRRRPPAARRLRLAGDRSGQPHRALRFGAPPDARPARHGRRPMCLSSATGGRSAAPCSARRSRSMASASPMPTGACAPPSTSSRCRVGPRTKASSSRSGPAARPMRLADALGTRERPAGEKAGR